MPNLHRALSDTTDTGSRRRKLGISSTLLYFDRKNIMCMWGNFLMLAAVLSQMVAPRYTVFTNTHTHTLRQPLAEILLTLVQSIKSVAATRVQTLTTSQEQSMS